MAETMPIPEIARTAVRMAHAAFMRDLQTLGGQTLDAMGLSAAEWKVDFDRGVVVRDAPAENTAEAG